MEGREGFGERCSGGGVCVWGGEGGGGVDVMMSLGINRRMHMLRIDKYSCRNNTYLGQQQVCNAPNMYTSLPFPSLSRTQYFSV